MQNNSHLNRRAVISGPIALAAAIGVGGTALAAQPRPASWRTGIASDFSPLVDQVFVAKLQDGTKLHLTLVDAEAGKSGPARPKNLTRLESVLLTFESDLAEELAKQGDHTVRLSHNTLGEFDVFLGATPRRSGGYDVELVLN